MDEITEEPVELDPYSQEWADDLIDKIMRFMDALVGYPLHPYQVPFARRIVESLILNETGILTGLWSRQSGKSETVANTVATLVILLPKLAEIYPERLGKFARGFGVGIFAPVEGQVETLFNRIVDRLTSEQALDILLDPEINQRVGKPSGAVKTLRLKPSGSFISMMTANPRAKIESRSFHLIIIDEAQDCNDYVVKKSIMPMRVSTNGTVVKIGTPTTTKGQFWRDIQENKRRQAKRGGHNRQLHFENHWKTVAKYNENYATAVKEDLLRWGEDSDEFQMSYCPSAETRILTADLRHIRADEIVPGMLLAGFDEERPGKGLHRRIKESVVEDVGRLVRPCYRVTLDDGTTVTSSSEHQWLVSTAGGRTVWKTTETLTSTDRIFRVTEVWDDERTYATGYLAAAFEGEGHLGTPTQGNYQLVFTQRDNVMLEQVKKHLDDLGFPYWESHRRDDVTQIGVSGRSEVTRFLGQVRPERLLDKFELGGSIGNHSHGNGFSHPRVVSSEFLGDQEVVAIRTSTRTFIAEGLASHNCLKWLLERGMFTTEAKMDQLGDVSMDIERAWHATPVVVGIDPARKMDSTVVTVVFVDWERPDEFGYYNHRVLNWLETQGEWPDQLHQIVEFLMPYNIVAVGVDASGLGDVVAGMLTKLLAVKNCEVIPVSSNTPDQSKRWKHLMTLMDRNRVSWPAGARTRRLRMWQRFHTQMTQAEKHFQGTANHVLIKAPEEVDAHDDYVDSLAIACSMTQDLTMPEVEVSNSVFYARG